MFNIIELFTWVDASYSVHPKVLSQKGRVTPMSYGMIHCLSSKQNLNEKSLTEVELIGTSEYVPFNIRMVIFPEAQGYKIRKNIIFQDNQITIRTEKNGRGYRTENSSHINISHLFVKYIFDKGEIEVKYCPTNLMITEYFTKPLQGKMFKMFRDLIMGYVHINNLFQAIEFSAKEHADKSK